MSTDDTEANLALIAEQTGCCNAFQDVEGTLSSTPITLTAGKKYFVQGLLKEGGGDDYIQVAWRKPGEDLNNAAGLQPISAGYLAVNAPSAGKSVTITQQPANASAAANQTAAFTVDFTSTPTNPVAIAWLKNGEAVVGASGKTYTTDLLKPSDNGAKIKAQVSVPGAVATSSEATLTVTADTLAPTITSITGSGNFTEVTLRFSEPVTAATAGAKANYAIDGGATISSVTVVNDTTVKLITSKQAEGQVYTVTVNNVADTATPPNTIAANTTKTFKSFVFSSGLALHRFWDTILVNNIGGLTNDVRFPDSPTFVTLEPFFSTAPTAAMNLAPITGIN